MFVLLGSTRVYPFKTPALRSNASRTPASRSVSKSIGPMPSIQSKNPVPNSSGGANEFATQEVPSTLLDAVNVFLKHPTTIGVLAGLTCLGSLRLMSPFTATDALIAVSVALFWMFQEWALHKFALHSTSDWFGRHIHERHHAQPYHHVCVDGPELVFGVMFISAVIFKLIFGIHPLGDTAIWAYWFMGLMYIWCHYLVHTRYIPKTQLMKTIRQNHMRHHCKDKQYWFSFTCPLIDEVMGSVPPRSQS